MRKFTTTLAVALMACGLSTSASALSLGEWYYDLVLSSDVTAAGGEPADSIGTQEGLITFTLVSDGVFTITDGFTAGDNYTVAVMGTGAGATNGVFEVTPPDVASNPGVDTSFLDNTFNETGFIVNDTSNNPAFPVLGGGTQRPFATDADADTFEHPPFGTSVDEPLARIENEPLPGEDDPDPDDPFFSSTQIALSPGEYTLMISSAVGSGDFVGAGFFIRVDGVAGGVVIPLPGGAVLLLSALGLAGIVGRRRAA